MYLYVKYFRAIFTNLPFRREGPNLTAGEPAWRGASPGGQHLTGAKSGQGSFNSLVRKIVFLMHVKLLANSIFCFLCTTIPMC